MFSAYEFSYAGESSLIYGLMLYDIDGRGQSDVPFGNVAEIVEARTNTRIQPIHFGVNYKKPLEFKLVFGSDKPLDRYTLENIGLWLTGYQNYQWLTIDQPDLDHVQFRCIVTQLTPISVGWLPVAFEATIRCDCPYAYGYPFSREYTIEESRKILFRNDGSVRERLKPELTFVPSPGVRSLSIVNHSNGDREFAIGRIPADGVQIYVDNKNGIILDKGTRVNLYPGFNGNFFRLVRGDNDLEVTGSGKLTISGRFLYNVGG